MSTTQGPPLHIWLQYHGDAERGPGRVDHGDVSWCDERVWPSDYCYVRAGAKTEQIVASAYAAGQSSKQAELDKAVELLRELHDYSVEWYAQSRIGLGEHEAGQIDHKISKEVDAYLSTLNPQPDAAQ